MLATPTLCKVVLMYKQAIFIPVVADCNVKLIGIAHLEAGNTHDWINVYLFQMADINCQAIW